MAESALTVQNIASTGLEATYAAANVDGNYFADDGTGRTFLHVKNGDASDKTVTIETQVATLAVDGYGTLARADFTCTVTAGEERMIGPFPPTAFKDSSGYVHATYSAVTSVTVAAIKLPAP